MEFPKYRRSSGRKKCRKKFNRVISNAPIRIDQLKESFKYNDRITVMGFVSAIKKIYTSCVILNGYHEPHPQVSAKPNKVSEALQSAWIVYHRKGLGSIDITLFLKWEIRFCRAAREGKGPTECVIIFYDVLREI